MKKLAVFAVVLALLALAAPAFAAMGAFMDVPMNHWAYDAIGQLVAREVFPGESVLGGYPDGTFKGDKAMTRYEMASALARALNHIDATKASKEDWDKIQELVVEFSDELEALRVKFDEYVSNEEGTGVYDRLQGWHIHGTLVLDVMNQSRNEAADAFGPDGKGSVGFDEARIWFERTWGSENEMFFRARLRGDDTAYTRWDRFYVEMPFFFDSRLLVGRQNFAWEGDYKISLPEKGGWTGDQLLTDWTWTGMALTKEIGLGTVQAVAAHPDKLGWEDWMVMGRGHFKFNEQFVFDLGGQAFVGDNAEDYDNGTVDANGNKKHGAGDAAFNNLWTVFAGLQFNFNDNIALKGTFYHQKTDQEEVYTNSANRLAWRDRGYYGGGANMIDDSNHWAAIIDIKQEALRFTSVWLEYGQFDQGFTGLNDGMLFYGGLLQEEYGAGVANSDTKYYRAGLGQKWNDQWSTYLFYYGYDIDNAAGNKPKEFGVGVSYNLNDYTTMGLNYMHADNDMDGNDSREDNVVRFRTAVSF